MALNKDILEDSGLQISYIRIKEVEILRSDKIARITLEKYISEDFRNQAKNKENLIQSIKNLKAKAESADDKDTINSLLTKAAELEVANSETLNSDYSTGIEIIDLDYIPEDLSMSGIYNELIKTDRYELASMI